MRVRLGYEDHPFGKAWKVNLADNKGFTLPSNIGELGDITELDLSKCSLQGPCITSSTQTEFF